MCLSHRISGSVFHEVGCDPMVVPDIPCCLPRSTPLCFCVPWKPDQCTARNPSCRWGSAMGSNSRRLGGGKSEFRQGLVTSSGTLRARLGNIMSATNPGLWHIPLRPPHPQIYPFVTRSFVSKGFNYASVSMPSAAIGPS